MADVAPDTCLISQLSSIRPKPYIASKDHTKSKDTRKPGAYDLHLDISLQLRNVVLCKGLPQALQRLYAKEMDSTVLSTPLAQLHTEVDELLDDDMTHRKPVRNESGIRADYDSRTGKFCVALASAILHHKYAKELGKAGPTGENQFEPLFGIDPTETTREAALPDLCISPNLRDSCKITPEIRKKIDGDIALLKKHLLSTICFLEIKSLICADEETMAAIIELGTGGIINEWMKCEASYSGRTVLCDSKGFEASRKKHTKNNGQQKETGRRTGPDSAVQLEWFSDVLLETARSTVQSPGAEPAAHDQPSTSTCKVTNEHRLKARYIVQQVWSELVAVDGTFGIISCGNMEIIVRRDRASRTLYISDVIRPSTDKDPSHYILHTALYVASWIDAVDRAKQLDDMTKAKRDQRELALPTWWKAYEQGIYDGDNLRYSNDMGLTTVNKPQQENEQATAYEQLSEKLTSAHNIYVDIPSPNRSQEKFKAADFHRVHVSLDNVVQDGTIAPAPQVATLQDDNRAVVAAQLNSTGQENVTLSFPRKLSEAVYQVTVACDGYSSDLFVIKLARNPTNRAKLLTECKEYLRMHSLESQLQQSPSVVVKSFGMFTCLLDQDIQYDILILAYGGLSAEHPVDASQSKNPKCLEKLHEITRLTERALANFHNHYGRAHNCLQASHVVYDSAAKEVRFISLAHATSIQEFEEHSKARRDLIRRDRAQLVVEGLINEFQPVEPKSEDQEVQASPTKATRKRRRARL